MKKSDAEKFVQQIAIFYDPSVPIEGLKKLLHGINYTCMDCGQGHKHGPLPLIRIPLDEPETALILINPHFARSHLAEEFDLSGWLLIISTVEDYYSVSGSIPPYNGISISPCYEENGMPICGNIALIK